MLSKRGSVGSSCAMSILSMMKIGSQQHAKPTTTATKRFVTLASSTFIRRSSGLFTDKKTPNGVLDTSSKRLG